MRRCGNDKEPGLDFEEFTIAWEWLGGNAMQAQLTARGKVQQATRTRLQREQERRRDRETEDELLGVVHGDSDDDCGNDSDSEEDGDAADLRELMRLNATDLSDYG